MIISNPPKALIALVGLICLTVLMALQAIEEATGTGLIGSILGYAIGNGIAARSGQAVEPIITRKKEK
jgi:membrane protein YqaA with SNARE-associated domain